MKYKVGELKIGGVLDQAVAVSKDGFGILFGITLILFLPITLALNLVVVTMMPVLPQNPSNADFEIFLQDAIKMYMFLGPLALIQVFIFQPLTNAALIHAISKQYMEQPVTIAESFGKALKRFFPLMGTLILMTLIIALGCLLIVPGILFALWYSLVMQVVVLEGTSGSAALGRSKHLMTGKIGEFIALLLVMFAINAGIGTISGLIPQIHVRAVVTSLAQVIATAFGSVVIVVFYFSCRSAKESFDLMRMAELVGDEGLKQDPNNPYAAPTTTSVPQQGEFPPGQPLPNPDAGNSPGQFGQTGTPPPDQFGQQGGQFGNQSGDNPFGDSPNDKQW